MRIISGKSWTLLWIITFVAFVGCSEDPESDANTTGADTGVEEEDAIIAPDTSDATADADTSELSDTAEDPDADVTDDPDADPTPDDEIWMTAYLASWKHYVEPGGNWGNMTSDDIDWDSFTHLSYFAFNVTAEGGFGNTDEYENMNEDRQNEIVAQARAHDKRVLASIGGAGNTEFQEAIEAENRSNFIANLVALIDDPGFDGIDLDMEPIRDQDVENYKDFVAELHAALQEVVNFYGEIPLLITATAWQTEMHAELAEYFDQINIMTYDMSGAWEGWVTWHNSPIFTAGNLFESTGAEMPSVDRNMKRFVDAGVPREKLGIGLDFYGYVWNGVSEPLEAWANGDAPQVEDNVPYHDIMAEYFEPGLRHWDEDVQSVYLSIPEGPTFVTYEDAQSMEAKVDYIYDEGFGGGIIWELGGGFMEDAPEGEENPLLDAIRDAM